MELVWHPVVDSRGGASRRDPTISFFFSLILAILSFEVSQHATNNIARVRAMQKNKA